MNLQSALDDFLLACEADGLSRTSLRWYKSILSRFVAAYPDEQVKDISANAIRGYLVGLKESYSEDSRGSYTRALHRFWKWTAAEYGIVNPMRNIRYPQKPPARHRAAELVDILKMFAEAGERDRAIIAFILDTGARAGGVCGLRIQDVDLNNRTAIVTEKGRKTRQVPFKAFTANAIREWLTVRRTDAEYLFHAHDSNTRLLPNGLYQAMRRLGRRAGVQGRFNPHALRHAFSNAFYQAGEGKYLVELARIMGHRDLRTLIENYVSRTDEHVRAAHDSYSPIDIFAALWDVENKRSGENGNPPDPQNCTTIAGEIGDG